MPDRAEINGPPQVRRQLDAEAPRESFHVGEIFFLGHVAAGVAGDGDFGGQAANLDAVPPAAAGEALSRKDPQLAVLHAIVAVSFGVEFDDVDVDLSPVIVGHHEVLGAAAWVFAESVALEKSR